MIGYNFIHEERNCARNNKRKRRAVNYRKPKLRRGCGIREVLFSFLVTTITLYNKRTMDKQKKKRSICVSRREELNLCLFTQSASKALFFFCVCVCNVLQFLKWILWDCAFMCIYTYIYYIYMCVCWRVVCCKDAAPYVRVHTLVSRKSTSKRKKRKERKRGISTYGVRLWEKQLGTQERRKAQKKKKKRCESSERETERQTPQEKQTKMVHSGKQRKKKKREKKKKKQTNKGTKKKKVFQELRLYRKIHELRNSNKASKKKKKEVLFRSTQKLVLQTAEVKKKKKEPAVKVRK